MPDPSDEELLDFDSSMMANWDEERARALLAEQHDLYRNHLIVARWIWGWAERTLEDEDLGPKAQRESYTLALREVAAHLRQGDLVPGGVIYEDAIGEE